MSIVKKSDAERDQYFRDTMPETCACFACGKAIWRTNGNQEVAVHWMGSKDAETIDAIYLHPECAEKFATKLIMDSLVAQRYWTGGQGVLDAFRKLLNAGNKKNG
jgi:hypothetical protein